MNLFRKTLVIGSLLAFITPFFGQSQKESVLSGVYLTAKDFQSNKLTYEVDCSKEDLKIKLHDFFEKPYFDVINNGKKVQLQKKDVYGYRNCENKTFRFFDNHEYQLEEAGNINVYSRERVEMDGKTVKSVKEYYFSSKPDGEIKELTSINLKTAFPDNHKFHDNLDLMFKDVKISEYDTFHKMFKVNHVYIMSLGK